MPTASRAAASAGTGPNSERFDPGLGTEVVVSDVTHSLERIAACCVKMRVPQSCTDRSESLMAEVLASRRGAIVGSQSTDDEGDDLTTDTGLGRRERKKLATRRAIQDAALQLAARDGVENVTTEQIADAADVAHRTFFNHFSCKEEAVVAAAAAGAESLISEFRARPPDESVLTALQESVLLVIQRDDVSARDHLVALRLIRDSPSLIPRQMAMLNAYEQMLAEAIAARVGPGAPEIYASLCAITALATLRVVLRRWLGAGEPPSRDLLRREVDAAFTLLGGGLDR
jgi:AcrR family transcriptional regulator